MRRRLLSGLAVALLCVSALPASAGAARSVAVLYFDNDTGDSTFDYLGKGLADMMVTDLAAVPDIQVVEREKLEALLQELKLQRTRYFDPKTAQKIGRGVGAEFAVAGAFLSVAPDIRIDVRVIRIGTGEIVAARKVVGQKDKFFELQQKLAAELIDGLGAAAEKAKLSAAQEATRVDDLGTAGEYGRGLDMRDRGDLKSASEQMQKVVEKAPRFALAKTRQMENPEGALRGQGHPRQGARLVGAEAPRRRRSAHQGAAPRRRPADGLLRVPHRARRHLPPACRQEPRPSRRRVPRRHRRLRAERGGAPRGHNQVRARPPEPVPARHHGRVHQGLPRQGDRGAHALAGDPAPGRAPQHDAARA